MAAQASPLCKVCRHQAAEYTCPRCNARYCSLDCYKRHSDRCTEGFYRDAAVSELRGISAGEDEKQHMIEILQRLHQQEVEGDEGSGSSDGEEGAGGSEEEDGAGLSAQTLHRLLAKMQASGASELEVSANDLSPAELAAFHRAMADGELSDAVQPWQPWWLSEQAVQLELGAGGTSLVVAGEETEAADRGQAAGQGEAERTHHQAAGGGRDTPGAAQHAADALPPPPSRPLPPLAALTKAAPSPLLRWQLLDLLYSYCLTLRRYNGDYQWEAADAADTLLALSAVLAAAVAPSSAASSRGSSGGAEAGNDAASSAAAPVLLGCLQRACQPPVGSQDGRGFAVGVLSDVAAMVQLGRSVVVTALMDTSRLLEAARQQLEGSSEASTGRSGREHKQASKADGGVVMRAWQKQLRRQLVAAERKLLFFLSWANEQPPDLYEVLALAAAGEQQKHAASLEGGRTAPPLRGAAADRASGGHQGWQQAAGVGFPGAAEAPTGQPRVLIKELD